ncbi:hypothetical protein T12_2622 [Trichinella patagoniensis]|uniref:Uncharacterized protein n=1 Tax=Trichinella patagoniensis TaxID=990121 RepID=A0A0V0ZXA4_9BILA|nr:hypothetical protein T12_2622 [Trichinella patagoniensis]
MTFLSAVSGQLISHSAARFEQAALVSKCCPNKGLTFTKIDKYFITQATNQTSVKIKGNYTSLKSVTNRYDHLMCVLP